MSSSKSWLTAAAVASALFAISAPAHAQTRTWVAGVGDDMNPCSRTAPCKTFAGAISKTSPNGIINCIDNGAYGGVTITKSITIDCHEAFASILTGEGGTGIIINVGSGDPKDTLRTVRLRNIDISGNGIGNAGISILSAVAVILEDMSITGMVKQGIVDSRSEGGTMLAVKNSIVANNAGVGVLANATQANNVMLDNVHAIKNAFGVAVAKGNSVTINRSVLTNNSSGGVSADSGSGAVVDSTVVSYNGTGVVNGGGTVALINSDVTSNVTGITGATTSFGNNRIFANTSAGVAPSPAGAPNSLLGQQ